MSARIKVGFRSPCDFIDFRSAGNAAKMIFRFGAFSHDTKRLELRTDGERRAVEPQGFSLLAFLVENAD